MSGKHLMIQKLFSNIMIFSSAGAEVCSSANTYTIAMKISYFVDTFIKDTVVDGTFCEQ